MKISNRRLIYVLLTVLIIAFRSEAQVVSHLSQDALILDRWELSWHPNYFFNSAKLPGIDNMWAADSLSLGLGWNLEVETVPLTTLGSELNIYGGKWEALRYESWAMSLGYLKIEMPFAQGRFDLDFLGINILFKTFQNQVLQSSIVFSKERIQYTIPASENYSGFSLDTTFYMKPDIYIDYQWLFLKNWGVTAGFTQTQFLTGLNSEESVHGAGLSLFKTYSKKHFVKSVSLGLHVFDQNPWGMSLFSLTL